MASAVVRTGVRSAGVAVAIVAALMCSVAGAAALYVIFAERFSWFFLGVGILLLVHGAAAWLSAYRRSASRGDVSLRDRLLSPAQWRLVATGYFVAGTVFLVAVAVGDKRELAAIAAVGCFVGGAVRIAVGRRVANEDVAA